MPVKNHNVDEEMRTENRFYIICPTHVKIKIKTKPYSFRVK